MHDCYVMLITKMSQVSFVQNVPELRRDLIELAVFKQFNESRPSARVLVWGIGQPKTHNSSTTILRFFSVLHRKVFQLGERKTHYFSDYTPFVRDILHEVKLLGLPLTILPFDERKILRSHWS